MKAITFLLTLIATIVQGDYVHDLDDQDHRDMISESGLNLSQYNREVYLKVTSNNGSTGYSWIIDHAACEGVATIESRYVYYEPESDDGWDVGYGEEIFTVTGEKFS